VSAGPQWCGKFFNHSYLFKTGLPMAYSALESGDRQTLERIKKGVTPEQEALLTSTW
jgi:hypothetical protein